MNGSVIGVLGGLAIVSGGVAGALLFRPPPAPAARGAQNDAAYASVAALEAEVAAQKKQIARLEAALASVERSVIESRNDQEAVRERLDDLMLGAAPMASVAAAPRAAALVSTATAAASASAPGGTLGIVVSDASAGGVAAFNAEGAAREAEVKAILAKVRAEEQKAEEDRDRKDRYEQAKRRIDEIAQKINLTPEQAGGLVNLWVEREEKQRQMWVSMRESNVPRDQVRELRQAARTEYETKVQTILSPAQYQDLQKIREEDNRRQREGWDGGGPGGR